MNKRFFINTLVLLFSFSAFVTPIVTHTLPTTENKGNINNQAEKPTISESWSKLIRLKWTSLSQYDAFNICASIVTCGVIAYVYSHTQKNSAPNNQTGPADNANKTNPTPNDIEIDKKVNKAVPSFENKKEDTFTPYLQARSIPKKVSTLAMNGVQNHKNGNLKNKRGAAQSPRRAGGRINRPWIEETFGQKEHVIENELKELAPPQTWTIKELDTIYLETTKNSKPNKLKANFTLVKGLSVTYLNELPLGKNCILQLASQFNYLESPGSYIVPVSDYLYDLTQGPQGSIEAAAAALYRTAAVKANKLQHALVDVLPIKHEGYYKNGYLEIKNYANDIHQLEDHIQKNLNQLRILPQWVICEASGNQQLQIFSAAPSFQGSAAPSINSPEGKICDMLVAAQYEAIGKIAVIQSINNPKESINVHLTLVGQGVFNNPPDVMTNAFQKVAAAVKGYSNIHVYIHGYSQADQNLVVALCKEANINCKQMTITEFVKAQNSKI